MQVYSSLFLSSSIHPFLLFLPDNCIIFSPYWIAFHLSPISGGWEEHGRSLPCHYGVSRAGPASSLAPSPCLWPQTLPSSPSMMRAMGSGIAPALTVGWGQCPLPIRHSIPTASHLRCSLHFQWNTAQVCLVNLKRNAACWPKPSMKILLICLMSCLQLQPDE